MTIVVVHKSYTLDDILIISELYPNKEDFRTYLL